MLVCWVLPYTKPRSVRHHPFKAPKSHAIRPLPPFLRFSAPFASRRDPFPAPGSSRSTAGHFKDHLNATPLRISPLECAVTSKHGVLPGFGRSCPPVTPLECAVTQIDAVTPLECALTKKGEGAIDQGNSADRQDRKSHVGASPGTPFSGMASAQPARSLRNRQSGESHRKN